MRATLILPLFVLFSCGSSEKAQPPIATQSIQLKATTSADGRAALSFKKNKDFQDASPNETFTSGTTLKTSASGQAALITPWSKRFELNNNTELTLLANTLQLNQGEIYVDAPPGKPLIVTLPQGEVTIDGAALNIKQQAKGAEINVLKGSVNITGAKGSVSLATAEGALLSPDGTPKKGPSADFTALTEWTNTLQRSIEPSSQEALGEDAPPPAGFGTLSAKTPGTTKERPFLLLSQNVSVTIEDGIARTEVEEVFENPSDVVVEGSFRFTLPEGASVTRYAMYVKDTLMEGEIVDREQGRKILRHMINEFLADQARLRDPALVEWTSGNTFSTRIFPILPREKKRIILAYTQRLDTQEGVTRYVYPLAAAGARDKVGAFRLHATFAGKQAVSAPLYPVKIEEKNGDTVAIFEAKNFQAPADLVLKLTDEETPKMRVVTSPAKDKEPDYFMLSLKPTFAGDSNRSSADWIILIDTSQSRTSNEMAIQRGLLPVLFGALDYKARVRVFAYDYTTRELTNGWTQVSDTLSTSLEKSLKAIEPAGATNIASAIDMAAKASEGLPVRVLLLGDLAPTTGELRPEVLSERAKQSFAKGSMLSTVGIGSVDELVLEALPRALGGVPYRISDGEDLSLAAMRILSSQLRPVLSDVTAKISGVEVSDVFPAQTSTLPMGRDLVLLGRYKNAGNATVTLTGKIGQETFTETYQVKLEESQADKKLLAPLWAKEKIDALSERASANDVKEITALSKQFGVMSRYTSYIVLENDAMYREFGIKQEQARKKAEDVSSNAGVVGLIKGSDAGGDPFASVFGRDDAVGTDEENILSGLLGDRPGEAEGSFGLGLRGTGIGGGGTGEGTIGLGGGSGGRGSSGVGAVSLEANETTIKPPSKTNAGGGDSGSGIGRGSAGFGSRTAGGPEVTDGKADIKGSLDKDIIRRVIRRAMPGIKFCYEQALQKNPELEGRIKIFFVIAPNGVVSSSSPTLGIDATVDACVARKISQLSFPAPQGGGTVEVTYPFRFEKDGEVSGPSSYSSSYGRYSPPQESIIQTTEKKPSEAAEKKLAQLRILLDKDPMVRGNHKKLVSQLIVMNMHKEALDAALVWRRLDGANVNLLKTLSELYRLNGRADEAVRMYSGVLDIDPEASIVVDVLASYASAKDQTDEAYNLRLGRAQRKADDVNAQLDVVEAAIYAQKTDEAKQLLSTWVEANDKGKASVTGKKLTGAQKTRAVKLYDLATSANKKEEKQDEVKRAELFVELSWEGDADLDVWVVGPTGRSYFGKSVAGAKNTERVVLPTASTGKYQVQVFDASAKKTSKEINAKILLQGFKGMTGDKKKETSVSIASNSGAEVGSIELKRQNLNSLFGGGFGIGR